MAVTVFFPVKDPLVVLVRTLMARARDGLVSWPQLADDPAFLQALLAVVADRLPGAITHLSPHERLVHQIRRHLAQHLNRHVQVGELAATFYLNAGHLGELFREHTGSTIKAYHRSLRLEAALRHLTAGERSITDIARSLGFSSVQRFSREFRAAYGRPPSQIQVTSITASPDPSNGD